MTLATGTRLGPYEILSALGAGGMGEVYRAHDARLGRDVAIKVLPKPFTSDPERLARFEREARALAALSHPNIATIHGVEDSGNVPALVMELVAGPTLTEKIAEASRRSRPGLPVSEAVRIAGLIAQALDAAHEKGIIHRDLKPANIKVTPDGAVKVLDFGLAKLTSTGDSTGAAGMDPTITGAGTRDGRILGTAAYMSPEQARGHAVDKRTDLWAFGCVLYEMLTGRAAFARATVADTLAAVVERDPDWNALPQDVPVGVARVVKLCLQKDVRHRIRDVGDVQILLADAAGTPVGSTAPRANMRIWQIGIAIALIALSSAATALWMRARMPNLDESRSVIKTTAILGVGEQLDTLNSSQPLALSPDGRRLVYAARRDGAVRLYLRELSGFDAKPLQGTEGASYPFFSPDSAWVAFLADGKLKRQSIANASTVTICDFPMRARGGTWGADGTIVIAGPDGLSRVPSSGGTPTRLGNTIAGDASYRVTWPHFLPDGRTLLATVSQRGQGESLISVSLQTGASQTIGRGSQPQYLPSGHLVFHAPHVREGELQAVGFDVDRLAFRGEPVSVLDGVFRSENGGGAHFAVAPGGDLVFGRGGYARTVVRVDRYGRRTRLLDEQRGYRIPRISPDGRRLLVAIDPRPSQLWVFDLGRRTGIQIANALGSAWTPDSQRVTFAERGEIHWRRADGGAPAERLFAREGSEGPNDWSRNGDVLLFTDSTTNRFDIWMWPRGGQPRALVATPAHELTARLAPDGQWLAYQSDESGREEIYVRPFPRVNEGKWLVSKSGGLSPAWSPSGRELFYLSGSTLIAVAIESGPGAALEVGTPVPLFDGPFDVGANNFDVSPDGTSFIMIEADPNARHTQVNVVLNWAEEIRRLLASR
ncbi:MAG TPA: protein kinase [Vicinamibacterales bacterium]|nr:protein kinase [Vicinamibacterales bacterium]